MTTLWLDTETFNEVDIKLGAYRYAEEAEVMLLPFAVDEDPVTVWDLQDVPDWRERLQQMVDSADTVVIQNSMFDRPVLAEQGVTIPVDKIEDTMVIALQHSLPAALGQLCDVLGVPQDKAKDKDGKKLIQLFCKPRPKNHNLRRATRDTHPDEWAAFIEYARLDVDAMRDVYKRLPRWNCSDRERQFWLADQEVNDRGIAVDAELATAAIRAFDRTLRSLAAAASRVTDGEVTTATQVAKLRQYLLDKFGLDCPDMTKGTVEALLKRDDLHPVARELLVIRQQASATSPAKYKIVRDAACRDLRMRGTMQFCGAARTGRDSGRIFQPQNLPRSSMPHEQVLAGIAAMKADCEDLLVDNVSELCASAVRSALVAETGNKLVVADLSNIEGRVAAWLAGEDWKLKAFRDFDLGTGHDLYVVAYARSFGVTPEAVIDNKKNGDGLWRQIGKVQELALQFQGGAGAFASMAAIYGVVLPEATIGEIVQAWRKAHPRIKSMWYDIEGAIRTVLKNPNTTAQVRELRFDVKTHNNTQWLRIRKPSGTYLCYPNAHLDEGGSIHYDGINQYTRKWETLDSYGGKFFENVVQSVARDVFLTGLVRARRAQYGIVLRVHDELVGEVPDTDEYTHTELAAMMSTNPSWSAGLPLAAAGFECHAYRKD